MTGIKNTSMLFSSIIPIILLILLLALFMFYGPLGVLRGFFPPVEKIFIDKVILEPGLVKIDVINSGPDRVTVSQILVNNVYYKFDMQPNQTLQPLQSGKITIYYPWLRGNPERITLLTSTGLTFEKEIAVAVETPVITDQYIMTFALLGIYVGLIPVFLGLLWLPSLRRLTENWHNFLLSLTVGLLIFLGIEAFSEAIKLIEKVPSVFNGSGVLVIGFFSSLFLLLSISRQTSASNKNSVKIDKRLLLSYLVALGIGFHNLGEGLAIGSAYAIGEISLGTLLVVGFMLHNVTEGLAIISPIAKLFEHWRSYIKHLVLLGILAGGPTIIGAWIGGFAYSSTLALLFLAVGIGAIFQVVYELIRHMAKGNLDSVFTYTNAAGVILGFLIVYITGFFVI